MIEELESLIITSAIQGEGKTNTVANLAYTIALTGKSVLMVDADLRKPALSTRFRAAKDKGLSILKALKRAMPAIQVNRRNNLSENDLLKSRKAMFRNPSLPVLLFIGRLTAQKKLLLFI